MVISGVQLTKCAAIVSLNMVEELWQVLTDDDTDIHMELDKQSSDSGEDLMEISLSAVQGTDCSKTVRLEGSLFGHAVVVLLDTGSSSSFISESLAR